uniref:Uncharacterized protein n=1 Tax=Sipha flava TaxID=143950 RepID=A0A2S2QRP0_9HEMI
MRVRFLSIGGASGGGNGGDGYPFFSFLRRVVVVEEGSLANPMHVRSAIRPGGERTGQKKDFILTKYTHTHMYIQDIRVTYSYLYMYTGREVEREPVSCGKVRSIRPVHFVVFEITVFIPLLLRKRPRNEFHF